MCGQALFLENKIHQLNFSLRKECNEIIKHFFKVISDMNTIFSLVLTDLEWTSQTH